MRIRRFGLLSAALLLAASQLASASPFPISGVGDDAYYDANVFYKPDRSNIPSSLATSSSASVIYTFGGGAVLHQQGDVVNGTGEEHRANGMNLDGAFMRALITLDQAYFLNRLSVDFSRNRNNSNASYQIRLFDGTTWTDLGTTPIGAANQQIIATSFTAQYVQQVEYTFYGSASVQNFQALAEISGFVAASAPADQVPLREQGYNLSTAMTIDSTTGVFGNGETAVNAIDGATQNFARFNPAGGTIIFDLGEDTFLESIRPVLLNTATNSLIEISRDKTNWTTIHSGALTTQFFMMSEQQKRSPVRYIRWTDPGVQATLVEMEAFAMVPEPASVAIVAAAGLWLSLRRRA